MEWMLSLLIIAGTSLDVFAAMECQGSLVRKVNKQQLSVICGIASVLQIASLFAGYWLANIYCRNHPLENESFIGQILAAVILVYLGIRLLLKAVKNERIEERLAAEIDWHKLMRMAVIASVCTFLSGIVFGFLQIPLVVILVMIVFFTVVFIIAGMYTGYHFGFEQKNKAYVIGAILLWIAGIEVFWFC